MVQARIVASGETTEEYGVRIWGQIYFVHPSESRPNDVIDYSYNSLGNITKKDDYFSTASYGNAAKNLGGNAGPNVIQ